ncbi:hypothetical protein KUTeg_013883 [Tegillarca granosa]|uniref:Uncharacterized protein n=1 Tax=Tegillarca granosa TaxID=220873 RepID=A0ABQ9EV04_TEGGR|nr:hypothetical protein KUTeg_013883 [Tegillarca granosa]
MDSAGQNDKVTMSELNEQVSDVIGEDENSDSIQTDGPAPCDEIQEVNKLENDVDDGVTEDVNNTDLPVLDSTPKVEDKSASPAKIKRNVSFPGDGAPPVLGYMDPPDPWRNGEKLDIRHCECLEEILRRVQFRTIDLEACHLDDETAVALFDMIEYYESACKVNISFNKNISFRGWQSCARLIRKTPCLTHLDARNCEINERVMPIMGRSLRMGCFLTTLHLENTNLSGRPIIILGK